LAKPTKPGSHEAGRQVVLALTPRAVLRAWILLTAVLLALSSGEFLLRYRILGQTFDTSELLFYLDTEGNFPVWAASLGLFCAGALAALAAAGQRPDRTATSHWIVVALGLTLLSIDEMAQYHEHLTEPAAAWLEAAGFGSGGLLTNAWVVPAALLLPLVAAFFLPFLRELERGTRSRLLLAAAVFLGGAMGMDAVSGREFDRSGGFSLLLVVLASVEEVLELLGTGLLLWALTGYLSRQDASLRFGPDAG
jgi:hypothetical protein